MKWYLERHRVTLFASYLSAVAYLQEVGIKFLPCSSGVFILLDLRELLYCPLVRRMAGECTVEFGYSSPDPSSTSTSNNSNSHFECFVDRELALWQVILDHCNVNLTPGCRMRCPEAGWFRLCFAYQPMSIVRVAIQRLHILFKSLIAGDSS